MCVSAAYVATADRTIRSVSYRVHFAALTVQDSKGFATITEAGRRIEYDELAVDKAKPQRSGVDVLHDVAKHRAIRVIQLWNVRFPYVTRGVRQGPHLSINVTGGSKSYMNFANYAACRRWARRNTGSLSIGSHRLFSVTRGRRAED
ncbi:MAG: hypothetical protein WCC70_12070 [Candidatus Aquilonibacter sp.]